MIIGGIQKNSFIDYPGKISCVLFLKGCNFHCPYCHNPELVNGGHSPSLLFQESDVLEFLEDRKGLLEGVVISGGEPTLQKDLTLLCEKIRDLGYPLKLDTNGSRPEVLNRLVNRGLVNYVAMDIKTDPFGYAPHIVDHIDPNRIIDSIGLVMSSGLPYEFRTTCVRPFVDEKIIEKIGSHIRGARQYMLQEFHNQDRILNPAFFEGTSPEYSEEEMTGFVSMAQRWVSHCSVR
ncbi:MAG: anaerobic ribonucleoside-triphosphate reductase activating protein [Desulfatiglandales bacterium]